MSLHQDRNDVEAREGKCLLVLRLDKFHFRLSGSMFISARKLFQIVQKKQTGVHFAVF